jgi:benzoyl-CoA reductase subunit D
MTPETLRVAGIDVGSSAIKVVVMEDVGAGGARVLARGTERIRRRDPVKITTDLFHECVESAGMRADDLAYVATTGEGENVPFRTGHFYGMTTHARGGLFLDPDARAVLDIGALHARGVLIDDHRRRHARPVNARRVGAAKYRSYLDYVEEIVRRAVDNRSRVRRFAPLRNRRHQHGVAASTPNIIMGIHQSMAGCHLRLSLAPRAGRRSRRWLASDVGWCALRGSGGRAETPLEPGAYRVGHAAARQLGAFRVRKLAARGNPVNADSVMIGADVPRLLRRPVISWRRKWGHRPRSCGYRSATVVSVDRPTPA